MVQDKKVSIILCFYNEEKYLSKAIDSILAQTYSNFELIIVNDGSTDGSDKIVKSYHDDRIKYIYYCGNRRQAFARNRGLEIATGDYIGFFDGDDIMLPDKIEKQVNFLEGHGDIVLITGGLANMDSDGIVNDEVHIPRYRYDEEIRAFMLYGNCVALGATLFRGELIHKHHVCFDESNKMSEDYKIFIDMLSYGKAQSVDECFYFYRVNHGSKASTAVKCEAQAYSIEIKKVLEHAWSERGFCLNENNFMFMQRFLYNRVRIWKLKDIISGVQTYRKIKRQVQELNLKEGKLILKYYKQQWLRTYQTYWLLCKIFAIEG